MVLCNFRILYFVNKKWPYFLRLHFTTLHEHDLHPFIISLSTTLPTVPAVTKQLYCNSRLFQMMCKLCVLLLFTFWFYANVVSYAHMMIQQRFEHRMLVLQHLNIWQKETHLLFLPWFMLSLANGVISSPSCTTAKMPSNWGVISLSTGFSCLSSCRYRYSLWTTGCDWTAIRLAFRSR